MKNWKFNVILFYIVCAIIIGYPFFSIKYFETQSALRITAKYLLLPIFISLLIFGPKFYFKKVKPLDNRKDSKLKIILRDIFSIMFMIICATGLFFGIAFSLIITTNKFFGTPEYILIKEPVQNYQPYITKNGRLRHYIDFRNPKTQEKIRLEVYRKYREGEIFEKEMKYGFWGILYSTE